MNTLRAFIAIEMPRKVLEIIRQSQQTLKNSGVHLRWVRPENAHLTLQFLGDIATQTLTDIQGALERSVVDLQPFLLNIRGIGAFPGMRRPRVIWLGVDGQVSQLGDLQQRLSELLAQKGVPVERRSFKGHLTIGRVKGAIDDHRLKTALSKLTAVETEPFQVNTVSLFKSDLKPTGAEYTPLVTVKIGEVANVSRVEH